ncbi:MAG: hypothetical protein C4297_00490 [Gemmataceae bacterium]
MKGPLWRIRYDASRCWECPVCRRKAYTSGDVVARQCECLSQRPLPQPVWMRLIEPPRRKSASAAPLAVQVGTRPAVAGDNVTGSTPVATPQTTPQPVQTLPRPQKEDNNLSQPSGGDAPFADGIF